MRRGFIRAGLIWTAALTTCFGASPASIGMRLPAAPVRHRIKLSTSVTPPSRAAGLLVKATVNGGPPLRLLLDSGTQYVVLDRKTAAKSNCSGGSDLDLVGAGAAVKPVKQVLAETLQVGDLVVQDVPLLITDHPLADGIQGALPLALFREFLIRLDVTGKNLDLLPYPVETGTGEGAVRGLNKNWLLFLKGTVNEAHEGYFLLDTGASYTAISRGLARELNVAEALAERVPLQGGTVGMDAPLIRGAVRLRVGARQLMAEPVVAVDLSTSSRYHGLNIAGLIGYPTLRDSVVTVNYRDGLVRIDSQ